MSTLETFRAKVVVEERRRRKAGNILIDALAGEVPPFPMTEEEEGEQERVEAAARIEQAPRKGRSVTVTIQTSEHN